MSAPATTETRTEYGIKYPDGSIEWRTEMDGVSLTDIVENKRVNTGFGGTPAQDAIRKKLHEKAQGLHINPAEYIKGHSIVAREIITVTMSHETAVKLEQPAQIPF